MNNSTTSTNKKKLKIQLWHKYASIAQGDIVSFSSGRPSLKILTKIESNIKRCTQSVLKKHNIFDYSPPQGLPCLIDEVNKHFIDTKDMKITITNGCQQAINITLDALNICNSQVIIPNPTYLGIELPLLRRNNNLHPIHFFDVDVDKITKQISKIKPHAIYVIPDFSNPEGKQLSLEKRKRIADLANKLDFIILEDQTYRFLNFSPVLPSIQSLNPDHTIVVGSISKIIVPGLRIGWIAANKKYSKAIKLHKEAVDIFTSSFNQQIIAKYLSYPNFYQKDIQQLKKAYQKKINQITSHLHKLPETYTWKAPKGGFYIWIEGPKKFKSSKLLKKAIQNGVSFMSGDIYYYSNTKHNTFRLSISQLTEKQIDIGTKRLIDTFNGKITENQSYKYNLVKTLLILFSQKIQMYR